MEFEIVQISRDNYHLEIKSNDRRTARLKISFSDLMELNSALSAMITDRYVTEEKERRGNAKKD